MECTELVRRWPLSLGPAGITTPVRVSNRQRFIIPSTTCGRRALAPTIGTANNATKHRDEAVDFVVRAPTNFDIAHALTFVASVPSYEPRKHMDILTYEDQDNPTRFLTQAEIWASRCLSPGVSHSPQSQEKVEVFPDWRGKAPLFYNSAMRTAAESILIGEATPKEALDIAKADIDAQLKKVRF